MIDPREALNVRHGFWKGITGQNLGATFEQKKETRRSQVPLVVDYNSLFGSDFVRCIDDIRRYIPSSLQNISLKGPPILDKMAGSVTPIDRPSPEVEILDSAADAYSFRRHLNPPADKTLAQLQEWLVSVSSVATVAYWNDRWQSRFDEASNAEGQLIVQSLFWQSLRRLESISSDKDMTDNMRDAYIVLDIADGNRESVDRSDAQHASALFSNDVFSKFADANARLSHLVQDCPRASALQESIYTKQSVLFYELFTNEEFCRYVEDVMLVDTYRTQDILSQFDKSKAKQCLDLSTRAELFDKKTIVRLRLTDWQVRELFVPVANLENILTKWQLYVYHQRRQKFSDDEPGKPPALDLSMVEAVTSDALNAPGETENEGNLTGLFFDFEAYLGELTKTAATTANMTLPISSPTKRHQTGVSTPSTHKGGKPLQKRRPLQDRRPMPEVAPILSGPVPTPAKMTLFSGKKYTKRACSQNDERGPKVLKLGDWTREDFAEQLKSSREEMKTQLMEED
ncbi:hypothetical protein O1611_g10639 [Lasiodiplodia mahajangana]|uniref:Uncharacterized protein n=1 Tax=Lasiodiplodia mahajangana TaxID=1108764 RepID=A0ACC2IVV2_9PEZI|nr:hypothetical protein O1611_g10639 [Lasiodiplodia mahajangana]